MQPINSIQQTTQHHAPTIEDNGEQLIQIGGDLSRLFILPIYYAQNIPNSLQSIYLREGAYDRLKLALSLLPEKYSFILYDGYRPLQVQQFLFTQFSEQIKKQYPMFTDQEVMQETLKYVAFPSLKRKYPAPHLTGGAIDLTLGDLNGNALNLGTAFDDMNEKSATRYFEQHPEENIEALHLRRLLYNCMTAAGFMNYSEEWWHYDFGNVTWARRASAEKACYGAVESEIQDNLIKGYRYI